MTLTEVALTRRQMLRGITGAAVAMSALPLLAACGGDDDESTPTATTGAATEATATSAAESTPEPESAAIEEPAAASTPTTAAPAATTAPEASPTMASPSADSIVVYCGRSETLVAPLIEMFTEASGIAVEARYAGTTELAALILEEGDNSPADVYFAQDGGALGAVAKAGQLLELPTDLLDLVDARMRSADGMWVGLSGRARCLVYNTEMVSAADLPTSIDALTDEAWRGRIGWVPTNASFQTFVTALRLERGEEGAREWLEAMQANEPVVFEGNGAVVTAVVAGELDAGLVNHYYLLRQRAEAGTDLPAENYIFTTGDSGALVNVAGAGVLTSSAAPDAALEFVRYMLSTEAQEYFAAETFEYPLIAGVDGDPGLVPLDEIETPDFDLTDLDDLAGTVALLTELGLI